MTRSLATPTFKSGPQDDLAAPDIYKISSTETINKIVSLPMLEEVKVDKMSLLQGGKSMLEKTKGALDIAKAVGGVNANGYSPLSQLMNGSSSLANVVNAIPKDANSIVKSFGSYVGAASKGLGAVASITATIGGVQQQITGLKNMATGLTQGNVLSKITAAGNLLNAATGTGFVGGIVNNVQNVAGIAGAVQVAAQNGIKGAFGAVVQGGLGTSMLNQVASFSLPSVIKNADIPSLSSMASNLAPGVLKGINPNILGDVTKAFSLPTNAGPTFMSETFTQVKDTFSNITPDWMKAPFGTSGETITDLSCVMGASKDFSLMATTAILSDPNRTEDDEMILAAVGEEEKDVHAELSSQFPATALRTSITSNEREYTGFNAREANIMSLVGDVPDMKIAVAPASSQPAGQNAITPLTQWTEADQDAIAELNNRFGYNVVKTSREIKTWLDNKWCKGLITTKERDLIARAPNPF